VNIKGHFRGTRLAFQHSALSKVDRAGGRGDINGTLKHFYPEEVPFDVCPKFTLPIRRQSRIANFDVISIEVLGQKMKSGVTLLKGNAVQLVAPSAHRQLVERQSGKLTQAGSRAILKLYFCITMAGSR
jgi:hypothetical protein